MFAWLRRHQPRSILPAILYWTALTLALFLLLFLVFFKLFPAVSIWEVAEGRVIEEARSQVTIPAPEASATRRGRFMNMKS